MALLLIKSGADVNSCDAGLRSALFYAIINQNRTLVKELLLCGASPYIKLEKESVGSLLEPDILGLVQLARQLHLSHVFDRSPETIRNKWDSQKEQIAQFTFSPTKQ